MRRSALFVSVITLAMMGGMAVPALAQQNPAGGQNAGGQNPGGPGGRMDPAQFRERMLNRIKEALGATDEEWKALQPKVEKVQQEQMQSMAGRFGGRRRPGGEDANANRPANPVADAARDLQPLLENKDATAEQIKVKLQALRDARTKAKEELTKAQNELREILTQRQEAVLVSMGMLD